MFFFMNLYYCTVLCTFVYFLHICLLGIFFALNCILLKTSVDTYVKLILGLSILDIQKSVILRVSSTNYCVRSILPHQHLLISSTKLQKDLYFDNTNIHNVQRTQPDRGLNMFMIVLQIGCILQKILIQEDKTCKNIWEHYNHVNLAEPAKVVTRKSSTCSKLGFKFKNQKGPTKLLLFRL